MSKFRQNRSNGLRDTPTQSFQDPALHLCAVCCDAMSGDYRSLVLYRHAAEDIRRMRHVRTACASHTKAD